ncbi:MAG: ABC transporter substrate-binding protein [Candidatus Adiutrix sp.]|jgi:iron complex transport system substrate-binding protein|nr:ABC transporter substrate-binding protein [Candidatus Adiutrix sp.]
MKNILVCALAAAALFLAEGRRPLQAQAEARPRIISLYAAHTEILLRLGAKDNLIGVSGHETYKGPETEGWNPPVFSVRDDVEKFLAARPDLILARPMHLASGEHLFAMLENAGVKVHSAQVLRAGDLYGYWRGLAELAGREEAAEKMIADFEARVSAYQAAAARRPEKDRPRVFIEAVHQQIKTFTPDSLPVWLVETAGGRNAADEAKAASPGVIVADYGPERLLAKADQVDIFISQEGPMNSVSLEALRRRSLYRPLKAFKEGRVYKISEDILARPTPSLLTGLETLAELTGLEIDAAGPPPSTGP